MELTQITETLYALPVPIDAKYFKKERHLLETGRPYYELLYNYDYTNIHHNKSVRAMAFEFEIIGTVTQEDIDFNPANYVESEIWVSKFGYATTYKNYTDNENVYLVADLSFRSLLSSKGINPTPETKLLIIEKV